MSNSFFQFKQFRIEQDKCAMKVGTDGVLLGAWTRPGNAERILDIGTGTGLIAIMLAQRSSALIDAIEIDEPAFLQAVENCSICPWPQRIKIMHVSFNEFAESAVFRYDLIVSNPPFHKETVQSPSKSRGLARHARYLEYGHILEEGSKLLTQSGRISLILPAAEETNAIEKGTAHCLFVTRITRIIPVPGKPASRCLLEFSKEFNTCLAGSLVIEEKGRHQYSEEYAKLTGEYYL